MAFNFQPRLKHRKEQNVPRCLFSPCPAGGGGVLSLSAVRQAGQLHFPLLASSLHLKCWWALTHVGAAHEMSATLVIAVNPQCSSLQLILMHGGPETFQHCLMWEALWVSIELCACETGKKCKSAEKNDGDDAGNSLCQGIVAASPFSFTLCIRKGKTLAMKFTFNIQNVKKSFLLEFRKIEGSRFQRWSLSDPARAQGNCRTCFNWTLHLQCACRLAG